MGLMKRNLLDNTRKMYIKEIVDINITNYVIEFV